ncbi:SAF domain-containing protein [Lederbergia lenta]|uniref:Flp pilus assembly protein CpaB n=1 Tax=Lederbergia lenta TaxID=1467 RepID=A0A2X4W3A1_LEDLE|nr:SAF domain-containing protein [Lederbergia lenta]MCM3113217.1 SAF domain-containing protein [Lederbergia lenta]MEC2325994.1 SAF domain-containing protein [Lederbergia lenta]SQI53392.1 Flp pilus assembly protein CpaB [Lederbergia lenta]
MIDAKRKAFIFLIIAFILAIVTGWFISNQVTLAKESMGQSVKVAVAKKKVPAYTEISEDMVDWINIPKSSGLSSFITNKKELEDHLSIVNLSKGDLITKNIVRSRVDIPEDHRIVWLNPTQNVLMDQEIFIGDKIDIIASYKATEGAGVETKRILNNIDVIQSEEVTMPKEQTSGTALKVSLTLPQAEQLIHLQNTAEQIRVLRVNQLEVEEAGITTQNEEQEKAEAEAKQAEKEAAAKQEAIKKEEQEKAKQQKEKEQKEKANKEEKK